MINAGAPLYRRNLISSRVELAGSRSGAKGGRNGDLANRRWRQIEWIALARDTDFSQAEWLARRLIEVAPMAVAPTLSHRYYPAFVDYPGGQSLFRETFTVMCTEVINGILRAGGRALVILNVGISAIGPLRAAIGPSRRPSPVKLAYVYEGANDRAPTAPLEEQARGSHADELETSAMLAITAKSVRLSLAQTYTREIMPGRAQPHQS